MVAQFLADLEPAVSRVRFEAYRPAGASELDMLVNYFFNVELSEALYPCLQAFEIALRNSIHGTLSRHFQGEFWFDTPGFLPNWQLGKMRDARDELTRRQKPHHAGRIVAELNFGFWHSLFNKPFERNLWRPNRSALIGQVFPAIPGRQRNRQNVWTRIEQIRKLRNRVFHYEPIWSRPHLVSEHDQILETLGWISTRMQGAIAMCDRFDQVQAMNRRDLETKINDHMRQLGMI